MKATPRLNLPMMIRRSLHLIPPRICLRIPNPLVCTIFPHLTHYVRQPAAAYSASTWREADIQTEQVKGHFLKPKKQVFDHKNHDVEPVEKYVPGGYHPVVINDVLYNRYRVVNKLGHSSDSTVWLAEDSTGGYVALKVCTSEKVSRELALMRSLKHTTPHPGQSLLRSFLHEFQVEGPNGIHDCYTMALTRYNIEDIMRRQGPIPRRAARATAAGLVLAVAFLHEQKRVHGDIQLKSVSIRFPMWFDDLPLDGCLERFGLPETFKVEESGPPGAPSHLFYPMYLGNLARHFPNLPETGIVLGALGKSFPMQPDLGRPFVKDCDVPMRMRPPETYFSPDKRTSQRSDIWMLGLSIWELVVGRPLFVSHVDEEITLDKLISRQTHILGPPPAREKNDKPLRPEGQPTGHNKQTASALARVYRKSRSADDKFARSDMEEQDFLQLMRLMLKLKPEERIPIGAVLRSRWLNRWALPLLNKSWMGKGRGREP